MSSPKRTRTQRTLGERIDHHDVERPSWAVPKSRRRAYYDDPEHRAEALKNVYKLAHAGMTDPEIADFLGLSHNTFIRWKMDDTEVNEALRAGKAECDARVERTLYQRAVGYTYKSEKVFQHEGRIIRAPVIEHVLPENTAMIFWLKNRRPDLWRDVKDHNVNGTVEVEDKTNRELAMAVLALLRGAMNDGDDAATVIEHLTGDKDGAV